MPLPPASPPGPPYARFRWHLLVLAWLAPGTLQLIQEATYSRAYGLKEFSLWREAPFYLPTWLPWVLLTPLVAWAARRLRPGRLGWVGSLSGHALMAVLAAGAHLGLIGWIRISFPPSHWPEAWVPASMTAWFKQSFWSFQPQGELLAYSVVVAGTLALDHERRAQSTRARSLELETRLHRARLATLQSQLRPHFLFNALNSALVLVEDDPVGAESMLHRISALLRSSLETDDRTSIPLSEELRILELYLGIEEVRFADRLTYAFEVDSEALHAEVPAWILQPLVENAVCHGLAPLKEGGCVWVRASQTPAPGAVLHLTVEDNGQGTTVGERATDDESGLGLRHTRARLDAAYRGAATMTLGAREGGGTLVELRLPVDASNYDPRGDATDD